MASRTLVRGLHTTRAVLSEKTALGFKAQPTRQRALPSLGVSASSRTNVATGTIDRTPRNRSGDRPPRRDGDRPPRREGDRPPRREGDRPPRRDGDRPPRRDAPAQSQEAAPRERASSTMGAVSNEFFEGADLAAAPASERPPFRRGGDAQRRPGLNPRKPKEAKGRGVPQFGDGSMPGEGTRKVVRFGERDGRKPFNPRAGDRRRPQAAALPPRVMDPVQRDTSLRSLFGPTSLIVAPFRRARDATTSPWAKGMDRADASKADLLRAAGDYSLFTPAQPTGKGIKLTASTSLFTIGMNPSISYRRRAPGEEIIKSYLG